MTAGVSGKGVRVVVVGSINLDLVLRVPRIVAPGETLAGSELREIPGGKGANQAVAAARLGAHVTMVGRVGSDAYGQTLLASLSDSSVDVSHVAVSPGTSGLAWIQVDDRAENSIVILPGANGLLSIDDVRRAEEAIAAADVVLLQLEIPIPTIVAAIELANRHHVPVLLDPAPVADDLPLPWSKIDTICPNQTELQRLTSSDSSHGASKQVESEQAALLQAKGVKRIVVTRGALGANCYLGPKLISAPAFQIKAVDSTAAGDAFRAAFAVALAERCGEEEALRFACAAGALASTVAGAQPSLPTREAIDRFLAQPIDD